MLRKISVDHWKSFESADLPINKITVLIGTNASGKSNALDALDFLSRTARGIDISSAIQGDSSTPTLRGGLEWATHQNGSSFTISAVTSGEDNRTDYEYSISIETKGGNAELLSEQLTRIRYQGNNPRRLRLFWTDAPDEGSPGIVARLYNTKSGAKQPVRRNLSVLSQLEIFEVRTEISVGVREVANNLREIFILDPNPSAMRTYSRPSETLARDGSNVAGVLASLDNRRKESIEAKLTDYASKIPEKDIVSVWAETVDRHKIDAMLYCREAWTPKKVREVDARGMSDGTLRFIAVMVALLTQPEGSLIVIEEIDNGLHPSRAIDLLNAISEIGKSRKIDLLITTHNVALLNALPPGLIRYVAVATRDAKTGSSQITLLDDLPYLSRLMADGKLGQLAIQGKIEQAVSEI